MKMKTNWFLQALGVVGHGAIALLASDPVMKIGGAIALGAGQAAVGIIAHKFTPKGATIPAGQ
jgi:hypothetical protein